MFVNILICIDIYERNILDLLHSELFQRILNLFFAVQKFLLAC